jgi:hypothetical protein
MTRLLSEREFSDRVVECTRPKSKMRKGLKRFACLAKRSPNTRTREDLEWFGPPECNTLLHCVLDCCGSLRAECLSLSV